MAVTNDTIANMPYWNILPMGVSNYGGDTQVYTVEPYLGSKIGMALNGAAEAQIPPFNYSPYTGIPIDSAQVDALARAWTAPVAANMNSSKFQTVSSLITSTKQKLTSKLGTEGITDESKQQIEALLQKLDELEAQLNEAKNIQDATEQFNKLHEIEVAARGVLSDAAQITVQTNEPNGVENNEEVDNEEEEEEVVNSEEVTTNTENNVVNNVEPQGANGELDVDFDAMADDPAARTIAQNFRDAINYTNWLGITGTDDEKFDAACEAITPENVVAVMLAYNKFHSTEDGESFMEAFMYDADGDQKPKFGKHIANCLKEVTIALGIYDECDADFTEIYDELGDFSIDNTIYECYDRILERICKAAGDSKYATRTNGESKLPVENNSEE